MLPAYRDVIRPDDFWFSMPRRVLDTEDSPPEGTPVASIPTMLPARQQRSLISEPNQSVFQSVIKHVASFSRTASLASRRSRSTSTVIRRTSFRIFPAKSLITPASFSPRGAPYEPQGLPDVAEHLRGRPSSQIFFLRHLHALILKQRIWLLHFNLNKIDY